MNEPACTGFKVCPECKENKHVLAFSADKKSKDGLYTICRECVTKRNKKLWKEKRKRSKISYGLSPLNEAT